MKAGFSPTIQTGPMFRVLVPQYKLCQCSGFSPTIQTGPMFRFYPFFSNEQTNNTQTNDKKKEMTSTYLSVGEEAVFVFCMF